VWVLLEEVVVISAVVEGWSGRVVCWNGEVIAEQDEQRRAVF
jgi:hypothetical protein